MSQNESFFNGTLEDMPTLEFKSAQTSRGKSATHGDIDWADDAGGEEEKRYYMPLDKLTLATQSRKLIF